MSNYEGYKLEDNVDRKENNTGDVLNSIGPNKNVKSYSTKPGQLSAREQVEREDQRQRRLNKIQPVKILTDEEKAALPPPKFKDPAIKIKSKKFQEPMTDDQFEARMRELEQESKRKANQMGEVTVQATIHNAPPQPDIKSQIEHLESLGFTAQQIVQILKMM